MDLLIFLFFFKIVKPETHYLRYMYTAMTKTDPFPEFIAEAESDDKQIGHFSNEENTWIRENLPDWTGAPKEPPETRQWYMDVLNDLSKCTSSANCSELNVLQRIVGCELETFPNGTRKTKSFNKLGFDGIDLLIFDSDTMKWIEKSPKAKEFKEKLDLHTEEKCPEWILAFKNTLKSSPDVYLFARKAPDGQNKLVLTCLATGFYPRYVQMDIRLDRTKLEDQTSEIRPNHDETFQMRTSLKIHRNHEGSYDCLVNHSSLTEPVSVEWDGTCSDCEPEPQQLGTAGTVILCLAGLCVFLAVIGCLICCRRRPNGPRIRWLFYNQL